MGKKLSGRTLATSLIPNRLHKTRFDPDCNLNVRYPFSDDDPVMLSFKVIPARGLVLLLVQRGKVNITKMTKQHKSQPCQRN